MDVLLKELWKEIPTRGVGLKRKEFNPIVVSFHLMFISYTLALLIICMKHRV